MINFLILHCCISVFDGRGIRSRGRVFTCVCLELVLLVPAVALGATEAVVLAVVLVL